MIRIQRENRPPPKLLSQKGHASHEAAAKHFENEHLSELGRFRFDTWRFSRVVSNDLLLLQHNKCAYCEQRLYSESLVASQRKSKAVQQKSSSAGSSSSNFELDHWRPRQNAREHKGKPSALHYWWFAYTWENLYLACATCNRSKRNVFPVTGERASSGASWDEAQSEGPLLLEPGKDDGGLYLRFGEEGHIVADPVDAHPHAMDRAQTTIDVLKLDRNDLRELRNAHAARVSKQFFNGDPSETAWHELLGDAAPFAALTRQMTARWILDDEARRSGPAHDILMSVDATALETEETRRRRAETGAGAGSGARTDAELLDALREDELGGAADPALEETPPEAVPPVDEPAIDANVDADLGSGAFITEVEITTFKSIHHMTLQPLIKPSELLAYGPDEEAPSIQLGWLSLLGENGVGKSSVLQAVALALAGPSGVEAGRCLGTSREKFVMYGHDEARVRVQLSSHSEPIEMRIDKSGCHFDRWNPPGTFLRAYGATRLPPNSTRPPDTYEPTWFENLFDSYSPLADVKAWLRGLEGDELGLKAARQCFQDILGLDPIQEADGTERLRIEIERDGKLVVDGQPLGNLSSGFQTLIALAADLMAGMQSGLSDMQQASGIVLLDEIGAHLHPAWKMRIVQSMRKAFAGMQFITTTHEPLCLRGHTEGEVGIVLREPLEGDEQITPKVAFRVRLDTDLPSPSRLRVDQLLTSKHFGLNSTIDPRIDADFTEYYQLLALTDKELAERSTPTKDLAGRRDELRDRLRGEGVLGYTRRDQLVYEAIDRHLAGEDRLALDPPPPADDAAAAKARTEADERKERVLKRIAALWDYTVLDVDPNDAKAAAEDMR